MPRQDPPRRNDDHAGDLAIVLHSHMPYVEGFGTYPFGEEWLFDAAIRSYLPVLEVAEHLTMTVTPVLADQLEAPGVGQRLRSFAREYRLEAATADATEMDDRHRDACLAEAERYRRACERLDELDGDVVGAFAAAALEGRVALLASAATHAVLPMLATRGGRRLQIDAGLRSHRRRFGEPAGFWLPECAYEPGLDALIAERGLRLFCVDQTCHQASPLEALAPAATPAGPVAFTIDWEAVSWLWSYEGYPSDHGHADFHRKSWRGTRAWAIDGTPYDPAAAGAVALGQAGQFVEAVEARLRSFMRERGRPGLLVFAIDTELLGHWWWEGPAWLAEVIRLAPGAGIELVTLPEALERHPARARPLGHSTWGEGKDLRTWDSSAIADMAWAARRLELRLLGALGSGALAPVAALRATRELLAVQASDWAFLDGRGQAGDYPFQRATGHAHALLEAIHCAEPPEPKLRNLAPDLELAPLLEP